MKINVNGIMMDAEAGVSALELSEKVSKELKKTALAAKLNGKVIGLAEPVAEEGKLEIIGFEDPDGARVLRHTASHVLAQSVFHR